MLVNTIQYLDTVDFVQDLETEDPQLVAELSRGSKPWPVNGKEEMKIHLQVFHCPHTSTLIDKGNAIFECGQVQVTTTTTSCEHWCGWIALRCELERVDKAARPYRHFSQARKWMHRQSFQVPRFGHNQVWTDHTEEDEQGEKDVSLGTEGLRGGEQSKLGRQEKRREEDASHTKLERRRTGRRMS